MLGLFVHSLSTFQYRRRVDFVEFIYFLHTKHCAARHNAAAHRSHCDNHKLARYF